ncbi:MAG TPA: transcriptional regulator [Candidatus Cloacimonadota bacterium]|nr:transcriptional regulator [Candidatus Cloacimonadota bacterium]
MIEEIISIQSGAEDIDRLIHEPARLNIMLYLYVVEEANFVFLQRNTGLTRGNLSVHLQKLEQGGYVEISKKFVDRKPSTLARLTKDGRKAFEEYRSRILGLLKLP